MYQGLCATMTAYAGLDSSAIKLETGFAGVVEQLADLRAGVLDLVARLEGLGGVLDDQKAQDRVIDVVAAATGSARQALAAACNVAAPPRVQAAYNKALGAVEDMRSQTRMLDAVASLSLITARSLGFNGLEHYVMELRGLSDALRQDASRVGEAVVALRKRRLRASELFAQADAALTMVEVALERHASKRAEKELMLADTMRQVGKVTLRLPRLLAAELDSLIQAMQFADAAAQRLDHIRRILSQGGTQGGTNRGSAESALAAAQINALVLATRGTIASVRTSLARIADMTIEAERVLLPDHGMADHGRPNSQADGVVELNRALLGALSEAAQNALLATDGATGEGAAVRDLAAEGSQRFESLAKATGAIHLAAINAIFMSRAASGQEKAIKVLSVDVQQQAAVCARVAADCEAAIAELTSAEDLSVFGAVSVQAQMFQRAMAETTEAMSAAGAALADLDSLRTGAGESLRALGPALQQADSALDQIAATADDLGLLAQELPRDVPAGSGPLTSLFDLYTMEEERAVHRKLFNLPEEETPAVDPLDHPAAASGDDDTDTNLLASVLF